MVDLTPDNRLAVVVLLEILAILSMLAGIFSGVIGMITLETYGWVYWIVSGFTTALTLWVASVALGLLHQIQQTGMEACQALVAQGRDVKVLADDLRERKEEARQAALREARAKEFHFDQS